MNLILGTYSVKHSKQLALDRCPHCNVAMPLLNRNSHVQTQDHAASITRFWATYICATCGGVVLAAAPHDQNFEISNIWPIPQTISESVPNRAREFLSQAIASMHAPAGAIMLTASAVDSMLKEKGLKDGNLNSRIDAAAKTHLITEEMATWAHEIRLDANDQRHADESAPLPNDTDAKKAIEFANALAQFLFVLPARVERGRRLA